MWEYALLSQTIDACCSEYKNKFINDICKDIEQHSLKYQTADLFKKARLLAKKFKPKSWAVEDANGEILYQSDEVTERWRCYCEDLYKGTLDTSEDIPRNSFELEPHLICSEVVVALGILKNKKTPGPDTIKAEILKALILS